MRNWIELGALVVAAMACGVGNSTWAQEEKVPSPEVPSAGDAPSAVRQQASEPKADANNQAMADRLLGVMDQLIPGGFAPDSPVPDALRQGALSLLGGKLTEAKQQIDAVVQADPTLPPTQLLMGAMYFSLNQGELGRLALEQAVLDRPEYPGVYTALARMSINHGWWASAAALLAQLRQKIDAGNWTEPQQKHFETEYLDALADTAIGQRRFDDARELLSKLQPLLPENSGVLFRLADVDFRQGKIDSALENLTKARSFDANLYPPELVLFQWASRQNQADEARRWIEAAADKFPEDRSVQMEYSRFLLERGNLAESATWLTRAEKNNVNPFVTRFLRGQIAFVRRAYQVAEADFRELMIQVPNDVGVRNMLALCLIESDDSAKQQTALEMASGNFRLNPSNAQSASTFGWVLYRLGNVQQAKQIFSQLTALPTFPSDTAYFVARMLIDDGQEQAAAKLLRDGLQAPGLFLFRKRAEEELAEIEKRLSEKGAATPASDAEKKDLP